MRVTLARLIQQLVEDANETLFRCPALYWDVPEDAATVRFGVQKAEPTFLLLTKAQPAKGAVIELKLGREDTNDIVFEEPSISRLHAHVHYDKLTQEWTITDAGSSLGTFLDGVKLARDEKAPLKDGCRVQLGEIFMTYMNITTANAFVRRMWTERVRQGRGLG